MIAGLPPGPIDCVDQVALMAALAPNDSTDVFFCAVNGTDRTTRRTTVQAGRQLGQAVPGILRMTGQPTPEQVTSEGPIAGPPRRAAVLGSPIAHSLSPVLHRAAYARLGLTGWSYGRHEVDEAALPRLFPRRDLDHEPEGAWAGLSLTMPLKRAVIPLLDEADPTALAVNAVNTLIFRADGSRYGTNTDVSGLAAALARARRVSGATAPPSSAPGPTAGSALAALSELVDGPITVYLRNPARLAEFDALVAHFGLELDARPWSEAAEAAEFELVINTTPAGAADALAEQLPDQVGTLFDVLYHPWPTPLAAAWAERGGLVLGGQDLLVHQAVRQVELMTGIEGRAGRDPLRDARGLGEELARLPPTAYCLPCRKSCALRDCDELRRGLIRDGLASRTASCAAPGRCNDSRGEASSLTSPFSAWPTAPMAGWSEISHQSSTRDGGGPL